MYWPRLLSLTDCIGAHLDWLLSIDEIDHSMAAISSINDSNSAPFSIPFEHPAGVALTFNFWSRISSLETEKDVCDLITSLLTGDKVDCIRDLRRGEQSPKIILAVAQGVDSTVLTAEAIHTSSFFKECSSVPINQQQRSELHSKISRAAPTDNIYSTLLWPEKPPSPFSETKYYHSRQLFQDFTLKFRVNTIWPHLTSSNID